MSGALRRPSSGLVFRSQTICYAIIGTCGSKTDIFATARFLLGQIFLIKVYGNDNALQLAVRGVYQ